MKTFSAKFLLSAPEASVFPSPGLPELAMVGRSNTGKSTLINSLVGKRGLARVSNQPGRTRSINFFEVEERFLLVDLPGYGYAAGPRADQATWHKLVESYLGGIRPLRGIIALFDMRRQPDERDMALLGMLERYKLTWQAVWTKADKLKRSQLKSCSAELDRKLQPPRPGIAFSSRSFMGRDALLEWVEMRLREPS